MVVFEAHGGGFSAAARGVLAFVAEQTAAAHNEEPAAVALKIAQRISCSRAGNPQASSRAPGGPAP